MTDFSQANLETVGNVPDSWTPVRERLTDGLSHDFNNLIAGIQALTEALRVEATNPSQQEALDLIKGNALKARALLQRLVALQRSQPGTKGYVNLSELTASTVELMKKAIPGSLTIATTLADSTLPVLLDSVVFTRATVIFTFAVANSLPKGSTLRLETQRHDQLPRDVQLSGEPFAGPAVSCTIKAKHPTSKPAAIQESSAWLDWVVFARSQGACVCAREISDTEVAYSLFLPEADLTRPDSLGMV